MQKLHPLAILASLTLVAVAPVCRAIDHKASAEISVLEDKDRAKVDVEELKRKQQELDLEDANGGNEANCGSVNIGNNTGNQTGSGRVAPHDTTVIVTGDVFNTATCGR
jgi:hypothetical protein